MALVGNVGRMLVLLSPAKSLDFESRLVTRKHSQPRLLERSTELIEVMRTKSPDQVASLMKISDELAALNAARHRDFETPFTPRNARPAVLAFAGDVYQGLAASSRFDERDFTEAQKTLRILSGLYGVLRPLDLIQPYRLEMGTQLHTDKGRNLYDFWGDQVTWLLAQDLAESPNPNVVLNLASQEYFGVVNPKRLPAEIISPRFEEITTAGRRRMVSFFAKRARGEMAGWVVTNRVRSLRKLRDFDESGYRYDEERSTNRTPVYVRSATV